MTAATDEQLERWRGDPVSFIEEILRDPETGEPIRLYRAQKRFIRKALKLTKDDRLRYPELIFSGPKKCGKTTLAAMIVLYVIVILSGPNAEAFVLANDFEQAQGRVFQAIARMVDSSSDFKVMSSKITFVPRNATITALANDYAGAAGTNANIVVFDELWAYTSERAHRLWDEMVPPPTRQVACRLTVTYAGHFFEVGPAVCWIVRDDLWTDAAVC